MSRKNSIIGCEADIVFSDRPIRGFQPDGAVVMPGRNQGGFFTSGRAVAEGGGGGPLAVIPDNESGLPAVYVIENGTAKVVHPRQTGGRGRDGREITRHKADVQVLEVFVDEMNPLARLVSNRLETGKQPPKKSL